jgi:hypothetical protein
VPAIVAASFANFSLILALMLAFTLVVGTIFAPRTAGLSLEEIQQERTGEIQPQHAGGHVAS